MITASPAARQRESWQQQLADGIATPAELCSVLQLDPVRAGAADSPFPLRVPRAFVARMRRGDYDDPLLRQVLPHAAETRPAPGFVADPLHEAAARRAPGLLQKYRHRALLIATAACGVHCRYCFRREYPYTEDADPGQRWAGALAALAADPDIEELILSGGDPLSLSNARLAELGQRLGAIAHLQRLRIHTRQPVVLPDRVDAGLCQWLAELRWRPVIVLHVNHAQEIDAEVVDACARLRATGATLLNQSVLLAGVNDSAAALAALSRALDGAGVLPYYLHLLDPVRGAAHFDVPARRARALHAQLLAELPGYLVPRLVRERPGADSKSPVDGDLD
jgi:EF-P beta-lysylation protein EpmB